MSKAEQAGSRAELSRDSIIQASLDLIDEQGLGRFSLRNLARRLGVYPTAVYWYVPTRELLLAGALAHALRDVVPPARNLGWREFVRQLFIGFREAIRRHPNVAPLIGTNLMVNVSIDLDFVERTLEMLDEAGFRGRGLVAAYNSLMAALVGFATQEFSPAPDEPAGRWSAAIRERLERLPSDRYPMLSANLGALRNQAFFVRWKNGSEAPFDDSYEQFVEILIRGLEAQAKGAGRDRRSR